MKRALVFALVLTLAGCAGGQPRMLTTSANQAEDQERLTSMMQNCYRIRILSGQDLREVRPFVELTPEQAAPFAPMATRVRSVPARTRSCA